MNGDHGLDMDHVVSIPVAVPVSMSDTVVLDATTMKNVNLGMIHHQLSTLQPLRQATMTVITKADSPPS
jgi:hypothetical protein